MLHVAIKPGDQGRWRRMGLEKSPGLIGSWELSLGAHAFS